MNNKYLKTNILSAALKLSLIALSFSLIAQDHQGAPSISLYDKDFKLVAFEDDLNNIKKLKKFELGIKPKGEMAKFIGNFIDNRRGEKINPFLSNEIRVYATFTYLGEDQSDEVREGFFYHEVERDTSRFEDLYDHPSFNTPDPITGKEYETLGGNWNVKKSEYPFRIRYAPELPGKWKFQVFIDVRDGEKLYKTNDIKFNVVDSEEKGFVKVGTSKRFLSRDGKTYMPAGMNAPFISRQGFPLLQRPDGNRMMMKSGRYSSMPPIGFYEQGLRYLDTMAMNGLNHFRLIMSPSSSDIEWEELGNYSNRQHIAKELDLILEKAEEHNILINWNFSLHFRFCENLFYYHIWDWAIGRGSNLGDPYNRTLGLEKIKNFFTDEKAKFYWKERLRYVVARWGYSPQIAMFELLSEIDQVGKIMNRESPQKYIQESIYEEDPETFEKWQLEMAKYLKEELRIKQLLTASYTKGAFPKEFDFILESEYLDLISVNNYNFNTSNVHGFHKDDIGFLVAHEGFNIKPSTFAAKHIPDAYAKPVFFSESGPTQVWKCDNLIETERNIWQNAFFGVSGSLDWEIEQIFNHPKGTTDNWSIYGDLGNFFEGIELDQENWHSGMTRLKRNNRLKYRSAFRDDAIRKDELADVVYLRSGDKRKAFGIITNRRANYWTLGDTACLTSNHTPPPKHSKNEKLDTLFQSYGTVAPGKFNNRLKLRNIGGIFQRFEINYYSPGNQDEPLKTQVAWGPRLKLEYPVKEGLDFILFEVSRLNESFR